MTSTSTYDAIIVGSGPNGLAAAIRLQQAGLRTLVLEQAATAGGATRTEELTLPGFRHDVGSAIHPLAFASPFLRTLPLEQHGLEWVFPEIPFAHALPGGKARMCYRDIEHTASQLGVDHKRYSQLMNRLTRQWEDIEDTLLGPLSVPSNPFSLLNFGLQAILPADRFNKWNFREPETRALFMGAAAHAIMPLTWWGTASFGMVLTLLAHKTGWPFPKGGAGRLTAAMADFYRASGGEIRLETKVSDLERLPDTRTILLDMTPEQLLHLKNSGLSTGYRRQLERYKYGAGVCKVDWALREPVPFTHPDLRRAGTIHFGDSARAIVEAEAGVFSGKTSPTPYVLFAQHSVFDESRAPEGNHTAWAYCHVPLNSDLDQSGQIEDQIEKAAPGFRDVVLSRSVKTTKLMEEWNPNLVGGDINGGRQDLTQLFTRPVRKLKPYRTSRGNLYICSSSTPPGGGVHGMCGYHAAKTVLKDHFN